jgi:hypothetical protein
LARRVHHFTNDKWLAAICVEGEEMMAGKMKWCDSRDQALRGLKVLVMVLNEFPQSVALGGGAGVISGLGDGEWGLELERVGRREGGRMAWGEDSRLKREDRVV